ncbi:ATP-binding cassette domain-containing protein [Nocardia sp. X0981]
MPDAIVAEGLVKNYGRNVRALDGLDLTVPEGTVTALLGPNGAGKTTTVRVLTTLLVPDSGRATVAGIDVLAHPRALRSRIGASGQYAAVDEYLTGFENLEMVGRLYHMGTRRSKERARELLERFRLSDAADRPVRGYSGGMRRRLDLAGALVADPPVLFLDEPTTGLDPRARLDLWDVIEELVAGGTTLLLTTQYMEEADRLADAIAVIDRGQVIARGTADELKTLVGGDRIELTVDHADNLAVAQQALAVLADGDIHLEPGLRRMVVPVRDGSQALVTAIGRLTDHGVKINDIGLRRPSLDDVFLTLTGHEAEIPVNGATEPESRDPDSTRDPTGAPEPADHPGPDGVRKTEELEAMEGRDR